MADRCQLASRVTDKLFSGRLPMKKPSAPNTVWRVSFSHGGEWRQVSVRNQCRPRRRLRRQPNLSCAFTRTNAVASCLRFKRLVKFRCTSCTTHGMATECFYCCIDFCSGRLSFYRAPTFRRGRGTENEFARTPLARTAPETRHWQGTRSLVCLSDMASRLKG